MAVISMSRYTEQQRREVRYKAPDGAGRGLTVGVRCHPDLLQRLDSWRQAQPILVSRPEAIRRLAELSLDAFSAEPKRHTRRP